MKCSDPDNKRGFARIKLGNFDRRFIRFCPTGGKPAVFQIARGDRGEQLRQNAAQRIDQLLRGHRRPIQLRPYRGNDIRVAPAQVHHTEAAQKIQVLTTKHILEDRAGARPFHGGPVTRLRHRLAVFQPVAVIVFGEVIF